MGKIQQFIADKTKQLFGPKEPELKIRKTAYEQAIENAIVLLHVVKDEKIPVILRDNKDIFQFHKDIKPHCRAYKFPIKNSMPGSFTLEFKNTKNVFRFFTLDSLAKIHPTDVGVNPEIECVIYLDTLPDEFYDEKVYVEDLGYAFGRYKEHLGDFIKTDASRFLEYDGPYGKLDKGPVLQHIGYLNL